jgi:hypothetical protein
LTQPEENQFLNAEDVQAALRKMGFRPEEQLHAFLSFLRFDANGVPCVLVFDGTHVKFAVADVVLALNGARVNLDEFWRAFDEVT